MDVLLDTCCVIWAVNEPESLSPPARDVLRASDTRPVVSPISCAELACLAERGRVSLDRPWRDWFNHYIQLNSWNVEVIGLDIIQEAWSLPGDFGADPADRILVATARLRRYSILTADRRILAYPHVSSLW